MRLCGRFQGDTVNVTGGGRGGGVAEAGSGGIAQAGLQVFWESLFLGEGVL